MAELSKPGSDSGATTSSASTSPSASAIATATGGAGGDQLGDDTLVLVDGTHQTGYVTPVSSSDTVHSRRCMSSSCDCALDSTTFGWPSVSPKPSGP